MTDCDACREKRVHTAAEWAAHHEYARHGFNGASWTHPKLTEPAAAPAQKSNATD